MQTRTLQCICFHSRWQRRANDQSLVDICIFFAVDLKSISMFHPSCNNSRFACWLNIVIMVNVCIFYLGLVGVAVLAKICAVTCNTCLQCDLSLSERYGIAFSSIEEFVIYSFTTTSDFLLKYCLDDTAVNKVVIDLSCWYIVLFNYLFSTFCHRLYCLQFELIQRLTLFRLGGGGGGG